MPPSFENEKKDIYTKFKCIGFTQRVTNRLCSWQKKKNNIPGATTVAMVYYMDTIFYECIYYDQIIHRNHHWVISMSQRRVCVLLQRSMLSKTTPRCLQGFSSGTRFFTDCSIPKPYYHIIATDVSEMNLYGKCQSGNVRHMTLPLSCTSFLGRRCAGNGMARTFASSFSSTHRCVYASSNGSNELKGILKKESEHERSAYEPPSELHDGPPEPFTLTEVQGDTLMSLTRTYGDNETVSVDIMIQDDMNQEEPVAFEDEETGEIDIDVSVDFIVSVSKRGSNQELVFECSTDGSFMEIKRVSLEPEDEDDLEDGMYTGPVFDELDDAVQEALYSYLEERGITPELGEYLLHLLHDKEQREYMDWLDKMTSFL